MYYKLNNFYVIIDTFTPYWIGINQNDLKVVLKILGFMEKAYFVQVKGLVQGVGFRPFVYRIARKNNLSGWVRNTNECVEIHIEGKEEDTDAFSMNLRDDPPAASRIREIRKVEIEVLHLTGFKIEPSTNYSQEITEISPDIAVCQECLEDTRLPGNRFHYPFVNCTNCGPRFTIIRDLPYDRRKTTMEPFPLCTSCSNEYSDVADRRFHAQPVACQDCGPCYEMYINGKPVSEDIEIILSRISSDLDNGSIVAIKGTGGYFLACDAYNWNVVRKMRDKKQREEKPFAVMFSNINAIRKIAEVSEGEEGSLESWRRPIVLLQLKDDAKKIFDPVNSGLSTIGAMLPYMPFHYMLFEKLKTDALVLTSGNLSDEPIIIDDREAIERFQPVADTVLLYNREIHNRADDSVIRIINNKERVFRRSRGYVPRSIPSRFKTEGIVAFGGELVNTFCIGKGDHALMSQHIGDLKDWRTFEFYQESLQRFQKLFRVAPSLLVCDLHPDYFSTRTAESFSEKQIPLIRVQHHHAHIASCMAEHDIDQKVIGVSFDGTCFGSDGKTWGAEFLVCDLMDFTRFTHFDYIPLPGGDKAVKEPWRMAVSYLYKVYGHGLTDIDLPFIKKIGRTAIENVIRMLEKNINCPEVSSAGRAFDALAALLNLCLHSGYEAQAPMMLESLARADNHETYPFEINKTISILPAIRCITEDIIKGADPAVISTKFHNTIISVIFEVVKMMREKESISKVVLSGGVFQNAYILARLEDLLAKNNFELFTHSIIPSNDGGISLGQLMIAAKRRAEKCV